MTGTLSTTAERLYLSMKELPIVSPHGHCDPSWFAQNQPFANPAALLVTPDHYVFRMLYAQGIPMADLGIGAPGAEADPREVFRLFAAHWHLFLGTPTRLWMEYVLRETLQISQPLTAQTADAIYDDISERLQQAEFLPRALFERFNIETLATTDSALDDLAHHKSLRASHWPGRVIPTFRPDGVLDPLDPNFAANLAQLAKITDHSLDSFDSYLAALRMRRAEFIECGATATDHAIDILHTEWLADPGPLYLSVAKGTATQEEARRFYGHMLIEMAQMSIEDGLVMQLHAGSRRNTNRTILDRFGRDMGADIPLTTDWVNGLDALLNRVGNSAELRRLSVALDSCF